MRPIYNEMFNEKFGARFALDIEKSDYTPNDILNKAGLSLSYQAEINKGISIYNYLNRVKSR